MNIHTLRIIWRRLISQQINNLVNMAGLARGMTGFILALLYLQDQLSYDTWDPSLNQVYLISMQQGSDIRPLTPAPLAGAIRQHYPAAASATAAMFSGDFEVLLAAGVEATPLQPLRPLRYGNHRTPVIKSFGRADATGQNRPMRIE